MAILTPILSKWVLAPLFRRYVEQRFATYDHLSNIVLMTSVLSAFISVAAYAGTSILFGAFLAGSFLTYLPSKHPEGPFVVLSREEGERERHKSPTFVHTFECYLLDALQYVLAPLFFASIGFAIPFVRLWTGDAIWKGVVYTLLMLVGKFFVGIWIPAWQIFDLERNDEKQMTTSIRLSNGNLVSRLRSSLEPALLLGFAMVARGEIGLLIVQIGYNDTPYVSDAGFLTAIWAIMLNTILGPIAVGLLVKYRGKGISQGAWGLVLEHH